MSTLDVKLGLKDSIPVSCAFILVSLSMGSLSKMSGLSALQTLITGLFIYATPLQIILVSFIGKGEHLLLFLLITLTINFRFFLMSASLFPYFERQKFYKILLITPLISASSFTVSHVRFMLTKKIDSFHYFLGMAGSSYLVSLAALMAGFYSNQIIHSNIIDQLLTMILPIHFVALTAQRWPHLRFIIATLAGFCLMPIMSMKSEQFSLIATPLLVASLMLLIPKREKKHNV